MCIAGPMKKIRVDRSCWLERHVLGAVLVGLAQPTEQGLCELALTFSTPAFADSELPVAVIGLPIPEKNTILRNDNNKLLPEDMEPSGQGHKEFSEEGSSSRQSTRPQRHWPSR